MIACLIVVVIDLLSRPLQGFITTSADHMFTKMQKPICNLWRVLCKRFIISHLMPDVPKTLGYLHAQYFNEQIKSDTSLPPYRQVLIINGNAIFKAISGRSIRLHESATPASYEQ